MEPSKALIAMSGGVDSSVAAYLMKEKGFECIGCTMKLYDNEDIGIPKSHTCCSLSDVDDARDVAHRLGMRYYVFNFRDDFEKCVIDKFIDYYEKGYTPNPCIDCNRYMKFAKLHDRAMALGFDYVVTGHYAVIEEIDGWFYLKKGKDLSKDQSYVLYSMTQEQLKHTMFPLGNMDKTVTREIAEKNGFVNANKPDSQDICFVPNGNYVEFIENRLNKKYKQGDFVDTSGNVLGKHQGIIGYTIGQRKGLGVSFGKPMYVVDKNIENNTVVLGSHEELFSKEFSAKDMNWIIPEVQSEFKCKAKVRYNMKEQSCTVFRLDDNSIKVVFYEPQRAITKGQAVVLYDGDTVLGGGEII